MKIRTGKLVMGSILAVSLLHADTVVLSNGDRVTGKVIDTADGKVTVKTNLMGEVHIDKKGIVSIETEEPATVTFADGTKSTGTVVTKGEQVEVIQQNQKKVARAFSALEAVRDADSQRKYEREQKRLTNPGWLDFWTVDADLGIASARGNARTTTINSGAKIQRATGFDKTTLTFEQIYSTQSTTEPTGTTANAISGGASYERNLTKKLFAYTGASFDYDQFQNLDLRAVLGGGLGWHIVDTDRTKWDFGAGGNWNREKFSTGLVRNSFEFNLFEKSDHQLTKALRVFQGFSLFPNMSDRGEYRYRLRIGTDFTLNSHLALTMLVSNKYLSNPLPGNKKNDLLFSTGIKFTWSQK